MSPVNDIVVDDALWPLITVRFLGVPTTQQVEAYLARMTTFLDRGERYVVLYDSSGMTGMGPNEQRHLQAAWLKQHDARLRKLRLGASYVIHSPLVRLAVSVVFYLKLTPSPYLITAKHGEAVEWAARMLDEDGQEASARRVREAFGLRAAGRQVG